MSVYREEQKVLQHNAQHIGSSIMLAGSIISGIQKRVRRGMNRDSYRVSRRGRSRAWSGKISVGGRCEALRPWQRSWGRRFDIRKGGIEPQESPWKSSSIYPHTQSLPTLLLCALTYTSDFTGGCLPLPLSGKRVSLQLQLIIPGCDSVSTYKLLWKSSSLPE